MLLSRNVVVSQWRCVGMALCRNDVLSWVVFVNGEMSGVKQSDDRDLSHIPCGRDQPLLGITGLDSFNLS